MSRLCNFILFAMLWMLTSVSALAGQCEEHSYDRWAPPIASVLYDACENGFDTSLLETKAAEGSAKRIAPDRIVLFLRHRLHWYHTVREAVAFVDPAPSPHEIALGGEAVGRGVPLEKITEFFTRFSGEDDVDASIGLELLATFEEQDFSPDNAFRILSAGFAVHGLTEEWRYFARVIPLARVRGVSDEKIAKVAAETLSEGGSVRNAMQILGLTGRNLFEEGK